MKFNQIFNSTLVVVLSLLISNAANAQLESSSDDSSQTDSNEATSSPNVDADVPTPNPQSLPAAPAPKKTTRFRTKTRQKASSAVDKSTISGTGYGIFGSSDVGMIFTAPSNEIYQILEEPQFGFTPAAKFFGTVFTRRIALDLGLGLQFATYSGTRIGQVDINNEDFPIVAINEPYSKTQPTLLIESAARIKFKQKFQAGLLATALYSNQSAGFSSLREGEGLDEVYNVFVGPQFVYETPFKSYISRLGASFTVSLTGSLRDAYIFNVHAGLGSFINKGATIINTKKETRIKTKVVTEVIPLQTQTAEFDDNIVFVFDSRMINFKLNSNELSEKSEEFITEIGSAFRDQSGLWEKLIIEGHTDSQGSASYNLTLSANRAQAVAGILVRAGLDESKLVVVGMGSKKKLVEKESSEVDFAKNRRVEIRPIGVKNARELKLKIDAVQNKIFGIKQPEIPAALESMPEQDTTPQEPVWDPGLD